MLYCNKIENEVEKLDPMGFDRHHDCMVEAYKMKLLSVKQKRVEQSLIRMIV